MTMSSWSSGSAANQFESLCAKLASIAEVATDSEGLLFQFGEQCYELPAEGGESFTSFGDDGLTVFADLDGDGFVDRVSAIDYEGSFQVFERADCAESVEIEEELSQWGWNPGARNSGEDSITGAGGNPEQRAPVKGDGGQVSGPVANGWECVEWG